MKCDEFKFSQSTVKFGGRFHLECDDDVKIDGTVSDESVCEG